MLIAAALSACGPNSARVEHEEDGSGLPLPWVQRAQTVSGPMPVMSMMQMAIDGGSFTTSDAGDVTSDAGHGPATDGGTSTAGDAGTTAENDAGTSTAGDAGTTAESDAGTDSASDAGTGAGASSGNDGGTSTSGDGGTSAANDAGTSTASDAGTSAGTSSGNDAGTGTASDAGSSAGTSTAGDAGASAGNDAGTSTAIDAGTGSAGDSGTSLTGDAGTSTVSDAGAGITSDAGTDAGVEHAGPRGAEISPHLALGIPDTSSVGNTTRWLLVRPQLATSYDTTRKVPNWTAWTLDVTNFGPATRATTFRIDPLLPTGTPQARDSDYTNSGFDRGHLCPSADRTSTDPDNDATFFLTNVVPQTHASNAGPWLDLEDEARTLANQGKRLVIIAGPIFGATTQTIGTGVHVPVSMFKVVVVLEGAPAPAAVTTSTLVYATIIPNSSVVSGAWRQWQVTIDDVEAHTGLDFLSDVDPAIQAAVERTRAP